jgi:hypothetical protein
MVNPGERFFFNFFFKKRQANKEISVDLQSISVDTAEKSRTSSNEVGTTTRRIWDNRNARMTIIQRAWRKKI